MLNQQLPHVPPPKNPLKLSELMLAVLLFGLGAWMLVMGWKNPRHVGWIPSGAIYMAGTAACAWLIWRWRGTTRNTLLPAMFTMQLANFVEGILKWQANVKRVEWPVASCLFGLALLILMIQEEIRLRKESAEDAARESKLFSMEDTP